MDRDIRAKLIEYARIKRTLSYSQLNDQLQLGYDFNIKHDRKLIGDDLGDISCYEHSKRRPLLSALVVRKGSGHEGDGFYKLCEKLGYGDWRILRRSSEFDLKRQQECFDFWRSNDNYRRFQDG